MTLALNYLIAFLLLITILYCWRLNKRIVELHKGKKELLTLLKAFDQAILRAEDSTKALKHACTNVGKSLQEDMDKAKFLVEDLNFMIERASSSADKLKGFIETSRHIEQTLASASRLKTPTEPSASLPPRPVFKAPVSPDPSQRLSPRSPDPHEASKSKRTSIELLLEKLTGKREGETQKPITQERRITYQSPEALGAMERIASSSSSSKATNDLLTLLKATSEV